ncbi:MAG: phosphoheptose isomerase [Candidatus Cloacimonetes bacterium 4572_55]|nr:MAG: phosphoheptose isomerase [Candidatus Cloacimonetes bacterium 4572_55]
MKKQISEQIKSSYQVKHALYQDVEIIGTMERICQSAINVYRRSGKLLIAGNGGSAADAQHIASELVGRFYRDRPPLPALALTVDSSIVTSVCNDYGFEEVFARQIVAYAAPGDMFIAISTSGKSPNILRALSICREKKIISVGLTGKSGGEMKSMCDYTICVPSSDTPRIQECHIMIGHVICHAVETAIFQ